MERFGPLATALGGRPLGSTSIPRVSIYLSIAAGIAAVIVLTTPALPAARRSLLSLKQMISRPPTRPAWARYALDVVLAADRAPASCCGCIIWSAAISATC